MDSSHILKPTLTVNYSIFHKLKRFFAAAILADWVLGNAVNVYIERLNEKGLLGLGSDFQASYLIWGETVWLNILHVLILAFTAGLFGFIFGYLSRKLSLSDKILFTTLYVLIRFLFLGIASFIIDTYFPDNSAEFNNLISEILFSISSSVFNATFVILGYIAMFTSAIHFMKSGVNVINDPFYNTDKSVKGTLLDIKWYHYFWLFIPIAIYSQIILNLIYEIGHTIVTLIHNFKWTTIFGISSGGEENAIDVAWLRLTFIIISAMIVIFLMGYLQQVLIGKTSQHWAVKILIAIGIGLIIPFLVIYYTTLVS